MGLVDKMKQQATQVVGKAQEAGKAGQARLESIQARRKAEALLAELGAISFRARQGEVHPGDEQRATDLVSQLRQYEAEYGPVDSALASDPQSGTSA